MVLVSSKTDHDLAVDRGRILSEFLLRQTAGFNRGDKEKKEVSQQFSPKNEWDIYIYVCIYVCMYTYIYI